MGSLVLFLAMHVLLKKWALYILKQFNEGKFWPPSTIRHAPFTRCCMVGQEDKRANNRIMLPALNKKLQLHAGHKGPVKKELLKGADLLEVFQFLISSQWQIAFIIKKVTHSSS